MLQRTPQPDGFVGKIDDPLHTPSQYQQQLPEPFGHDFTVLLHTRKQPLLKGYTKPRLYMVEE